MRQTFRRYLPVVACAALALLALALRLYAIDRQSLWADEGSTLALASRAPLQIAQDTARDVHPPLYYWLLHGWMLLFGDSVAALRGFSAVCGALAAALTAALAWRWHGAGAALVAGIAAALSPFAIHYGQEARMYALLLLLTVCVWLALSSWVAQRRTLLLLCYCAAALAALYTHYFAVTLVLASGIAGLAALLAARAPRTTIAVWCGAHALLATLYAPWVWYSRERLSGWATANDPTGPLVVLGDALRVFALGPSTPPGLSPILLLFAALLAVGLLLPLRAATQSPEQANSFSRGAAALWLLLPLAVMVLLSLDRPFYRPRFLILALPAFHILLGRGAVALAQLAYRWLGRPGMVLIPASALALALSAIPSLTNEWFDPVYWRDDYRGIAQTVATVANPEDIVIANGQGQIDTLAVYDTSGLPYRLLPSVRPLDPAAVVAELEAIARTHRRLYGVFYVLYEADPAGVIPTWLAANAYHAGSRWYGGVQLAIYDLMPPPGEAQTLAARFGQALTLQRAAFGPVQLQPGESLRIRTEWERTDGAGRALSLFVHLVDAAGVPVAQYDGPLADPSWPADGSGVRRMALLVPPDLAPGSYRLLIGVYDPATGMRERLADGTDVLELTVVTIP